MGAGESHAFWEGLEPSRALWRWAGDPAWQRLNGDPIGCGFAQGAVLAWGSMKRGSRLVATKSCMALVTLSPRRQRKTSSFWNWSRFWSQMPGKASLWQCPHFPEIAGLWDATGPRDGASWTVEAVRWMCRVQAQGKEVQQRRSHRGGSWGLTPLVDPLCSLWHPTHRWGSRLSKITRNSARCFTKSEEKEEKAGRSESARMSRQARSDSQSGAGFCVTIWMEPPDRR